VPRSPTGGNRGNGGKWIWPRTRRRIYWRDGLRCVWCKRGNAECLDHVVPRVNGGTNRPTNLVSSCLACNEDRGDRSAIAWAFARDRRRAHRRPPHAILNGLVDALGRALP
jgi:5-methylcytosine-specific restriction endonuclease McrA